MDSYYRILDDDEKPIFDSITVKFRNAFANPILCAPKEKPVTFTKYMLENVATAIELEAAIETGEAEIVEQIPIRKLTRETATCKQQMETAVLVENDSDGYNSS